MNPPVAKQNECCTCHFSAPAPTGSWVDVNLTGRFTCGENTITFRGFYADLDRYLLRLLPGRRYMALLARKE